MSYVNDNSFLLFPVDTSFTEEALVENFNAIFNTIAKARPATVKGAYMKNLVVSTTMGPGIHVEIVK